MNPMLAKLMAIKGKSKEMPEAEKEGKLSALKSFSDMAHDAMGEKLGSVKKVTVAAPDQEGLEKGLDKAKQLVEQGPEGLMKPCDEASSPEEIDAEIQRLMELKAKKEGSEDESLEDPSDDMDEEHSL